MKRVLANLLATAVLVAGAGAAPVENNSAPNVPVTQRKKISGSPCLRAKASRIEPKPYQVGRASWYGKRFDGRSTASGEPYDMFQFTAAHRTLPLGTLVRVTSLRNGHAVVVRVNDRGPMVRGRIIDLSYAAAQMLQLGPRGVEKVRLDVVDDDGVLVAQNLNNRSN